MPINVIAVCVLLLTASACSSGANPATTPPTPTTAVHGVLPVLGWIGFLDGDRRAGWGTVQPDVVKNEGDDSSFVYDLRWRHWGGRVAIGFGRRHASRPKGGNYGAGVLDELRATNLGACHGKLAYRTLYTRQARRPDSKHLGRWAPWTRHHGAVCGKFGALA